MTLTFINKNFNISSIIIQLNNAPADEKIISIFTPILSKFEENKD